MHHASEAIPLSKISVKILDRCIQRAIGKIFSVYLTTIILPVLE